MENIAALILMALVPAAALMFIFWAVQLVTRNAGIVDLGWALGLMIHAGVYAFFADGYPLRKALLFLFVGLWALRMALLLIPRLLRGPEDRRYALLRKDWSPHIDVKFLLLFEAEVLLNAALSLAYLIICLNPAASFHPLEFIGALIWVGGLTGEIVADRQLKTFKRDVNNKGKICRNGLWNYSRHPNYFFEWLMWVGYCVIALSAPYGVVALVSPAIMLFLLLNVTGIPMIEQHARKTKGDAFKEYERTTSLFFPLPKRIVKES